MPWLSAPERKMRPAGDRLNRQRKIVGIAAAGSGMIASRLAAHRPVGIGLGIAASARPRASASRPTRQMKRVTRNALHPRRAVLDTGPENNASDQPLCVMVRVAAGSFRPSHDVTSGPPRRARRRPAQYRWVQYRSALAWSGIGGHARARAGVTGVMRNPPEWPISGRCDGFCAKKMPVRQAHFNIPAPSTLLCQLWLRFHSLHARDHVT